MGKGLLSPNGRSCDGKGGRGSSMAGSGGGWLAKHSIESNDGRGGGGLGDLNVHIQSILYSPRFRISPESSERVPVLFKYRVISAVTGQFLHQNSLKVGSLVASPIGCGGSDVGLD
ncbi:hypothetical protein Tco_1192578 [Tanacetum coccineum]